MYYIYWIKKKEDSDILSEGYIGYSNNPKRRFEEHKKSKTKVGNAIRKHDENIDLVILYSFDNELKALAKENELRPKKRIGWNIACGGQKPPAIKDNTDVKHKISKSIKQLGTIPYCEKTHLPESIKKSNDTKKRKKYKWYYNPSTLESRVFSSVDDIIPSDWMLGRKPKIKERKTKIRGVDYNCNVKKWEIYKNEKLLCVTENLKKWCETNGINYFAGSKTNDIKILSNNKKIFIKKSQTNTIIVNGIDTGLISKDHAKHIGRHPSYISTALKRGFYVVKEYDVYKYKKINN